MGRDLAARAELVKLARALGTTTDEVAFAADLPPDVIRRVRERVVAALYDQHRSAFQRVAAITRVLPTALNVRIALRAFPPLLAARVAGEMSPERAADLANRMPVDYLAETCVHLDPRRAAPLVAHMRQDRVLAVVAELVDRREFVTLGRLLDAATEPILRDVAATMPTAALLLVGFYAESDDQLTRAVSLLPPGRLRGIVRDAVLGPPEQRSAGLALVGRLTDERLLGRLAEDAVRGDDRALLALLSTAIGDGAVAELLRAIAAMSEEARRRALSVPGLAEPHVLASVMRAVRKHDLWHLMASMTPHMTDDLRARYVALSEEHLPDVAPPPGRPSTEQ